jgi:hypothetical protein
MNADLHREKAWREAFLADVEVHSDGERCPDAERIWSSAAESPPAGRDDDLLLHLGECGACAAAWRVARELDRDDVAEREARETGRASTGWRSARLRWGAAAALLIAAAALGVIFIGPWTTEPPVYRTQEGYRLLPSGEDGESLPRGSFVLRWTAGPVGSTYDVRVTSEELDLLARGSRLEQPTFQVPAEALEELPSGARIFWQVTAHLPDGRRVDSASFLALIE